jgi:hypothetical protein
MATTIFLSPENSQAPQVRPDCDEASSCNWFETSGDSPQCANRKSMVCQKRLKDVFAPHYDRSHTPVK